MNGIADRLVITVAPQNDICPQGNTALLLSSEVTVTRPHHSLLESNYNQRLQELFITVNLGAYFSAK
jgi:heme/copper-type cytochrome/quinol oxidase subunit 3